MTFELWKSGVHADFMRACQDAPDELLFFNRSGTIEESFFKAEIINSLSRHIIWAKFDAVHILLETSADVHFRMT